MFQLDAFSAGPVTSRGQTRTVPGSVPARFRAPNKRAHRTDPDTSREAAAQIEASGELGRQARDVLALVRRYPGSASIELAAMTASLTRAQIARRLPDLEPIHAVQGPQKRVGGRNHVTWWPVAP